MELSTIFKFIEKEIVGTDIPNRIAKDARLQFGTETQPFLFAKYLPVENKENNEIYEEITRIGTFIANDGSPLSPPQIKRSSEGLGLRVRLAHIDIATQMDARDMRTLGRLLNQGDRAVAVQFVVNWITRTLRFSVEAKAEVQRAEAFCNATVTITPMDGAPYLVQMPNPPGHRVTVPSGTAAAPTGWYSPNFDPIQETLVPIKLMMQAKGYEPMVIITSSRIAGALQMNPNVSQYGRGLIIQDGNLTTASGIASDAQVNVVLQANGLPPMMRYDRFYQTQTGSARFFPDDKFLIIGATGRDAQIEVPDDRGRILRRELIMNTLGYTGRGVSEGQTKPGAVITVKTSDVKPVGCWGESYAESFPVILDYEAVACVTVPALAA